MITTFPTRFPALRGLMLLGTVAVLLALIAAPGHQAAAGSNLIDDPSFEAGRNGGIWKERSTNFGTPICSFAVCGDGAGTAGPRTGSYWAWFGGADDQEEIGVLQQRVRFPSGGSAFLRFYLWIGDSSPDDKDWLRVFIDGQRVFKVKENSSVYDNGYVEVEIDVSAWADGEKHKILFKNKCTGDGNSNFNVDDVSLMAD